MALVQSPMTTSLSRDGSEGLNDQEELGWYANVDNWDFQEERPRTRDVPAGTVKSSIAGSEASSRSLISADAALQTKAETWTLLNQLETEVFLEPSHRPGTKNQRDFKRCRPLLTSINPKIQQLESKLSEFARQPILGDVTRCQLFLADCRGILLDLDGGYYKRVDAVVLEAFTRVSRLMLQYRDVVDPFNTCLICSEARRLSEFPKRISSTCQHPVSCCASCLKKWVAASLEQRGFTQLACMECNAVLQGDDVRAIATAETFQRYDELSTRKVLHDMPDFYFCLNPNCKSGQIHYGGAKLDCHVCKNQICAKHGVAWHKDETCTEYDARRTEAHKEFDATEVVKANLARVCPTCKTPIEKNGGCDHMTCSKCESHFSWGEAVAYAPNVFFWDRDNEKLSGASKDKRRAIISARWFRKLFLQQKQPVRARAIVVTPPDTLEDGCSE